MHSATPLLTTWPFLTHFCLSLFPPYSSRLQWLQGYTATWGLAWWRLYMWNFGTVSDSLIVFSRPFRATTSFEVGEMLGQTLACHNLYASPWLRQIVRFQAECRIFRAWHFQSDRGFPAFQPCELLPLDALLWRKWRPSTPFQVPRKWKRRTFVRSETPKGSLVISF